VRSVLLSSWIFLLLDLRVRTPFTPGDLSFSASLKKVGGASIIALRFSFS